MNKNKVILYVIIEKECMYTFKTMEEITKYCLGMQIPLENIIIYNEDKVAKALQDDAIYDRIDKAEFDRFDLDKRIARNGYKRLVYNLNKIGLTIQEWDIWCTL